MKTGAGNGRAELDSGSKSEGPLDVPKLESAHRNSIDGRGCPIASMARGFGTDIKKTRLGAQDSVNRVRIPDSWQ